MRKYLVLCLLLVVFAADAQSKKERQLIERTYLLSHTVFGTKDSVTLEDLFAKTATYGHSGGKIENREEAVRNIAYNKSVYTDTTVSNISVIFHDDVAIVRHTFKATETKADGKATALNLGLMLIWVKEKGKWRLFGRQAIKLS
jgi:hypothetical protein